MTAQDPDTNPTQPPTHPLESHSTFHDWLHDLAACSHIQRLHRVEDLEPKIANEPLRALYAERVCEALETRTSHPTARAAVVRHAGQLRLSTPSLRTAFEACVANTYEAGRVRKAAAWALGWIGTHESVAHLSVFAQHRDPMHRCAAIQALGRLELSTALKSLSNALQDPSWKVRQHAAIGLGGIPTPHATQALETLLDHIPNEPHTNVAEHSLRSVCELTLRTNHAHARAETLCLNILHTTAPNQEHTPLRRACARNLGELHTQRAIDTLHTIVSQDLDHSDVLAQAQWALHQLNSPHTRRLS